MLLNRRLNLTFLTTFALAIGLMAHGVAAPPEGKRGKNSPKLSVLVTPESFTERDAGALGIVTRENSDTSVALTVTLESSDESEATVAANVEIPVGEVSAEFAILAEDDTVKDGDQSVTISVSATDHSGASASIIVIDDEGLPQVAYVAHTVAFPMSTNASLNDFNDAGMAVGRADDAITGEQRAWLYDPAVNVDEVIDLNSLSIAGLNPDWTIASAVGINETGVIVGYLQLKSDPSIRRGFVLDLVTITLHELPDQNQGWADSYARKVNDNGDVLGWFQRADGSSGQYLINLGLVDANLAFDMDVIDVIASTESSVIDNPAPGKAATILGQIVGGGYYLYNRDGGLTIRSDLSGDSPVINDLGDYATKQVDVEVIPINRKKTETVTNYSMYRNVAGVEEFIEFDAFFNNLIDINNSGVVLLRVDSSEYFLYHDELGLVSLSALIAETGVVLGGRSRMNNYGGAEFTQIAGINTATSEIDLVILTPVELP